MSTAEALCCCRCPDNALRDEPGKTDGGQHHSFVPSCPISELKAIDARETVGEAI